MIKNELMILAATGLLLAAAPLNAQDSGPSTAPVKINPAAIQVPRLDYASNAEIEKDFDKYYYFHREGTEFDAALADIVDCDNLSRGISSPYGYAQVPYPYTYTMSGAVGGAIANALIDATFGSAQRRAMRRLNMRRCMHFKGYQRYGLPKDIWQEFNFEEGLTSIDETMRGMLLRQQAEVASGSKPDKGALGR